MTDQLIYRIASIFSDDQRTRDLFFSLLRGLNTCQFDLSTILRESVDIPESFNYQMRMHVHRRAIARVASIALTIDEHNSISNQINN